MRTRLGKRVFFLLFFEQRKITLSFSENTFSEITESELLVRQQNNDLELLRIELESKKLQIESLKHDFQVNNQ